MKKRPSAATTVQLTQPIDSSRNQSERQQHTSSTNSDKSPSPTASGNRHQPTKNASFLHKLVLKASDIGKLFFMVSIAALIGSIAEARKYHLIFGFILKRFSKMMRLPVIVGLAMPTALYSSTAANSMLVSSHAEGKIEHSSLIAGGMANSYLAYVSHSLRIMYPVIGAVGLPGLMYFGGQFFLGFLFILGVLLWHRRRILRHAEQLGGDTTVYQEETPDKIPLPWKQTFVKAGTRIGTLLFRMMLLTVPLMLFVEWLMKKGIFEFWEQHIPSQVTRIFPSELVSIVFTQVGGLVQSASIAANLRDYGVITNSQILLAMLVGNAVGNPFRMLRRNLPSALGIFPTKEALTIVFGMQISRIICTILLIVITALFIHYTH